MTKGEALKKMQAVKAYMTSGNPIWDVTEIGEAFGMAIEALEQPDPQWIPCSERLPELDEAVLATTAWNDITIAWRIGICEWFIHEGNTNAETADVIAWMPLPEPYKGKQG